jgi:glycosyltransferase involved in cell wall biosynthesis
MEAKVLISIVSGTFNRLEILQRMVSSVRSQMYKGMDYEFVIVDGGSTDGTLGWCADQPDIHLIEHGELRGAIPAFCDGARAAKGEYVILANDDIWFHDYSILSALAHLEDNPQCGAVAFADNRFENRYAVQVHPTRDSEGNPGFTPYAQVGMFPRWLGNKAGWWGDRDKLMKNARTYAGDNFLSQRIWEMGYTIETAFGCKVHDSVHRDDMRQLNSDSGEKDSQLFYTRFDNGGAIFGARKVLEPKRKERLRILYLPIYEDNHPTQTVQKRGLRDAFQKLGIVAEYDFVTRFKRNINTHDELTEIVRLFRPHVLFTQAHRADTFQLKTIQQMRYDHPEMLCINWHGDVWYDVYMDMDVIELLQWYDLALVVNETVIEPYAEHGITAAYWQVASEEPTEYPEMPAFDVLFLANCYSDDRRRFGEVLKELPYNVGLYGSGWGDLGEGTTLYDFSTSHALMKNAKICIGDTQHTDAIGFVSNRFFETLHAGAFLLHQPIPGFDRLTGFKAGKHYAIFTDDHDLVHQVKRWLNNDEEREKIRLAGHRLCKRKHSFNARVKQLFDELIPELVEEGLGHAISTP